MAPLDLFSSEPATPDLNPDYVQLQALRAQHEPSGEKFREVLKVDAERLDRLLEMIGELVIAESMVARATSMPSATRFASSKLLNRTKSSGLKLL